MRQTNKGWTCLLALLTAAAGCMGEIIVDPDMEVARFSLRSDTTRALVPAGCEADSREQGCARYPNPNDCDRLEVHVMGDGRTRGACALPTGALRQVAGIAGGVPFDCRYRRRDGCMRCRDLFGTLVLDHCEDDGSSGAAVPEQQQEPAGAAVPTTATATVPGPEGGGAEACDAINARKLFVKAFNDELAGEGLRFSYQPDLSRPAQPQHWYEYGGEYEGRAEQICDPAAWGGGTRDPFGCVNGADPELCNCENHEVLGARCWCARFGVHALQAACAAIPAGCDRGRWAEAFWAEDGAAYRWLFGAQGQAAPSLAQASSPGEVTCIGSPLLLDLEGDGVALSSAAEGVRFDLTLHGAQQTAWVAGGDDALLALDRDGNGRIDDGGELFGDARSADGFAALARLDAPGQGGNGDGVVDGADALFERLLLWQDHNRDGVSQRAELRGLATSGIVALETQANRDQAIVDRHGNDLTLRARFRRDDGSDGLLVDVYFVAR